MAGFISSATVLSFASGPLTLAALHKQLPKAKRPSKLPGGMIIAFLGFFSSNLLVYWTGWNTNYKLFLAVLLDFVMLGLNYVFNRTEHLNRVNMAFKADLWYIPWLVGLAIIFWMAHRFALPTHQAEQLASVMRREAVEEELEFEGKAASPSSR